MALGDWLGCYEGESEVAQLFPTLCDPMDCSLPGSFTHGIFQARTLEAVAISFPSGSSNPGIEPRSPTLQADSLPSEPPGNGVRELTGLDEGDSWQPLLWLSQFQS